MPYTKLVKNKKGFSVKNKDTGKKIQLHTRSKKQAKRTLRIRESYAKK